jgi:hypothetical protein
MIVDLDLGRWLAPGRQGRVLSAKADVMTLAWCQFETVQVACSRLAGPDGDVDRREHETEDWKTD